MTLERRYTVDNGWQTVEVSEAGGDGGLERLGPYAVTYQTPGLADPSDYGAHVGPELAIGTIVLSTWFAVTTTWVAATGAVDVLSVYLDPSGHQVGSVPTTNPLTVVPGGDLADTRPRLIRTVPQYLAVGVYTSDSGGLSAGAADIYALIVPSS